MTSCLPGLAAQESITIVQSRHALTFLRSVLPAALLIMTSVMVIESLSHSCVAAEQRCLAGRRSLGLGCDGWHGDGTEELKQHIKELRLGLFWNINDPGCLRQKPKSKTIFVFPTFFVCVRLFVCFAESSSWWLLPGTNVSSDESPPRLPLVPQTGAWVSPPSPLSEKILGLGVGVGVGRRVKSFTNICNAIMLNYGWSTFA